MGLRRDVRLDNLSNRLEEVTSALRGEEAEAERRQRPAVVEVMSQYMSDRYELGKSLAQYRAVFKHEKVWVRVCEAIADAMGKDERTVRRIIADYERAKQASNTVRAAMKAEGFSPLAAKNRDLLARVIELTPKDHSPTSEEATSLVRQVLREFRKAPATEPPDPRDNYALLTPEERQFFALRLAIRRGLNDYKNADKRERLWEAIAQEACNVWGITKPFTVTITPQPGQFTVDGRKRPTAAEKDTVA